MEHKTTTPLKNIDIEQRSKKTLKEVMSFKNSKNNIKEMITYLKDKSPKSRKIHNYYGALISKLESDKKYESHADLLKLLSNKNYNVDHAKLPDNKLRYEVAKEMYLDEKALGDKNTCDKSLFIFKDYFNHQLSWFLAFPQYFHQKFSTNFVLA